MTVRLKSPSNYRPLRMQLNIGSDAKKPSDVLFFGENISHFLFDRRGSPKDNAIQSKILIFIGDDYLLAKNNRPINEPILKFRIRHI